MVGGVVETGPRLVGDGEAQRVLYWVHVFAAQKNFFYEADMAKWQKGQSGNPGGRKKGFGDLRELARTHTNDAVATLVTIMNDRTAPHGARVSAAESLLDRGWGRPVVQITAEV